MPHWTLNVFCKRLNILKILVSSQSFFDYTYINERTELLDYNISFTTLMKELNVNQLTV